MTVRACLGPSVGLSAELRNEFKVDAFCGEAVL